MLKFIGIGNLANEELLNTSAYIKQENKLFIIDCGVMSFKRMLELNLFEDVDTAYITITHMHPDHIGGLASLISYLNLEKNIIPKIVVPSEDEEQKQDIINFLFLQGVTLDIYELVNDVDLILNETLLKINFRSVKHSQNLKSYAIEMTFDNGKIYYLGDNNDEKYHKSLAKKLSVNDLIYTDCCDEINEFHINLEKLAEIYDEKLRKQIYCMHFNGDETVSKAKNLGFSVAVKEQSKEEYLKRIISH